MTGGSVEATLELWASSLRDVKGRIGPLFQQARTAHSAGLFLDALHRHFIDIAGTPEIRAREWGSLGRVSSHRDPDQVAIPNNAVGRVKLDPAGPGQIDLNPRVRGSAPRVVS
jgi:hypothetical protein